MASEAQDLKSSERTSLFF